LIPSSLLRSSDVPQTSVRRRHYSSVRLSAVVVGVVVVVTQYTQMHALGWPSTDSAKGSESEKCIYLDHGWMLWPSHGRKTLFFDLLVEAER